MKVSRLVFWPLCAAALVLMAHAEQTPHQMLEEASSAARKQTKLCEYLILEGITEESLWNDSDQAWRSVGVKNAYKLQIENKLKGRYLAEWSPRFLRTRGSSTPFSARWELEYRDRPNTLNTFTKAVQSYDGKEFLRNPSNLNLLRTSQLGEHTETWVESFMSARRFLTEEALRDSSSYVAHVNQARPNGPKVSKTEKGYLQIDHSIRDLKYQFRVILDPARDYLLLYFEKAQDVAETPGKRDIVYKNEVSSAVRLPNGAWFPTQAASITEYSPEYAAYRNKQEDAESWDNFRNRRYDLKVTNVEVPEDLSAAALDSLFTPQLPEKVRIQPR